MGRRHDRPGAGFINENAGSVVDAAIMIRRH